MRRKAGDTYTNKPEELGVLLRVGAVVPTRDGSALPGRARSTVVVSRGPVEPKKVAQVEVNEQSIRRGEERKEGDEDGEDAHSGG